MRQFAAQRAFFQPPREFAGNSDAGSVDLDRLLMLAIDRAMAPPVVHRRRVLQPMRIVVVDPALLSRSNPVDGSDFELPKVLPRILPPPAVNAANTRAARFHQRAVRGEILSDENGRLYEKLGRQIRPIHQLASGQFGEAIDLVPLVPPVPNRPAATRVIDPPAGPSAAAPSVKANLQSVMQDGATSTVESDDPDIVRIQQAESPRVTTVSHRKLFADPGQWRVVWWGEFKEILARQLAHPERLHDTYRLPCYVQVLETERTLSIDELVEIYKSDSEKDAGLYFLTDDIAAKLDLILPLRPAPPHQRREPHTLLAHERVFRLVAANDPTIDVTMLRARSQASRVKTAALTQSGPTTSCPQLKEAIPDRFVKEWESQFTREEASYEMKANRSLSRVIRRFFSRMRVFKQSREFRKWQTLLAGRSVDEQLWAVHPPAGMLADSLVREWAGKTLEHGGYDSQKMMIEWEIFWRRRGL